MAPLALASITLDGVALALDSVIADVTIRHGRTGFFDSGNASTAQLSLLNPSGAFVSAVKMGAPLIVNHDGGGGTPAPRFTGRVTDAVLDDNLLTLDAVGLLSQLETRYVASGYYNSVGWSTMLRRLFSYAGIPYSVPDPFPNPILGDETYAAEETTLASAVDGLVGYMGAAVVDTPDGAILVQCATTRSTANAVNIPPSDVAYTPEWRQVLPGLNKVTITGDTDDITATKSDAASITQFGLRKVAIDTTAMYWADVDTLARHMVVRQAWPKWVIESATLLSGYLFAVGQPVRLSGFQPSAPHSSFIGIVEGWTDRIFSDGETLTWQMDVSLSDPLLSGIGEKPITWTELPTAITWANMDQFVPWNDALNLDDFYP